MGFNLGYESHVDVPGLKSVAKIIVDGIIDLLSVYQRLLRSGWEGC